MKKVLIFLAIMAGVALLAIPTSVAKAGIDGAAEMVGDVIIGQNTPVELKITNNSNDGGEIRKVAIWVPQNWRINYPGHNRLIRDRNYGPWSTLISWNGASGRSGYNAQWFIATTGTEGIPAGESESFPLTLKTPTNVRMYPQVVTFYWAGYNTSTNEVVRGEVSVNVVRQEVAGISTKASSSNSMLIYGAVAIFGLLVLGALSKKKRA